ncbi:MAG: hypothetical protein RLZZ436_1196 [Planctomycetota bacterium]|jgi:hypothetical protein
MSGPIPLFVVGSGRSGTTILAALLNLLPGVFIAKETGFIGARQRELVLNGDADDFAGMIPDINSYLEHNDWQLRASVEGLREFCGRYQLAGARGLLHYIWQLEAGRPWDELRIVGDNTPLYVMAIPALLKLFPEAKFIHIVRDPRDVVCSVLKMRFGACEAMAGALEWHHSLGCWLLAERIVPASQRMECRYEDLCTAPESTFAKIASFAGASAEAATEALRLHAAGGRQPSGFERIAKWEHHKRLAEPLSPARVGRFRRELSKKQIQDIESVAQYGMQAYGYEMDNWLLHPMMLEDRMKLLKVGMRDMLNRLLQRLQGK